VDGLGPYVGLSGVAESGAGDARPSEKTPGLSDTIGATHTAEWRRPTMRALILPILVAAALVPLEAGAAETVQYFSVPAGARPHDVAPAPDGAVWYTAQRHGALGRLDPATGEVRQIPLGDGSAPHGVIVGPDGAAWITDGGLDAIVRVDPKTEAVKVYPLPDGRAGANLNTAAFDGQGRLWFTGQNGVYGRLDPESGAIEVFDAPRGRGPYGITATPSGEIYYASLAGHHIARIDPASGRASVLEPPTEDQGARRIWSDSRGRLWVSEWNAGQVTMFDPATSTWRSWKLPGDRPLAYAGYRDARADVR
jgi:virginiamycin B lyase